MSILQKQSTTFNYWVSWKRKNKNQNPITYQMYKILSIQYQKNHNRTKLDGERWWRHCNTISSLCQLDFEEFNGTKRSQTNCLEHKIFWLFYDLKYTCATQLTESFYSVTKNTITRNEWCLWRNHFVKTISTISTTFRRWFVFG